MTGAAVTKMGLNRRMVRSLYPQIDWDEYDREVANEADLHPRTYSLTASGPNGELFLVTDDESGINIGHAKLIGGPLTAPRQCFLHTYELAQPKPARRRGVRQLGQHVYDIDHMSEEDD